MSAYKSICIGIVIYLNKSHRFTMNLKFFHLNIKFKCFLYLQLELENGLLFHRLKSYWIIALGNSIFKYRTVIRLFGIDVVESNKYNHGYDGTKSKMDSNNLIFFNCRLNVYCLICG
jgi:hypothetical protein